MFDDHEDKEFTPLPAHSYLHREYAEAIAQKAGFWAAAAALTEFADMVERRVTVETESQAAREGAEAMRHLIVAKAREMSLRWMADEVDPSCDWRTESDAPSGLGEEGLPA